MQDWTENDSTGIYLYQFGAADRLEKKKKLRNYQKLLAGEKTRGNFFFKFKLKQLASGV